MNALASLILASETSIPLAIAIAGRWGSGKSTFVRQLRAAMDSLLGNGGSPTDPSLVGSICQIEFNEWHYSDDHLWVGLIEALFSALSARFAPESDSTRSPEEVAARIEVLRTERELLHSASDLVEDQPGKALSKLREAGRREGARHIAKALLSTVKKHLWAWAGTNSVAIAGGVLLVASHHVYGWFAAAVPATTVVKAFAGTFRRAHEDLKERLTLTRREIAYLRSVACLLHTPRAAKRLANTYRLLRLRVSTSPERLQEFLAPSEHGAEFQAAAVLLAIQAGDPAAAGAAFRDISRAGRADAVTTLMGEVDGRQEDPLFTRRHRIRELLEILDEREELAADFALYAKWCPIVAGFSLHCLINNRRP